MNQPRYRRPLNDKQLALLSTIYRFRFITAPLIARLFNIRQSKAHERLKILFDQEYIGRQYDKKYRLQGKAAAYYLMPKGTDALASTGNKKYLPEVLKRLGNDSGRSDRFVNHWLGVLGIYCRLNAQYGDRLRFFTNTELVPYKYFIQPRPDTFLRLGTGQKECDYFLDYLDSAMPRFAMVGRIRQYTEYADEEEWQDATKTRFPIVILICDDTRTKNRLKRILKEELEDAWSEDLQVNVCTPEEVATLLDKPGPARAVRAL